MAEMTVLGLDPGLRRTGFAVALVDPSQRAILKVRKIGGITTSRTVNHLEGKTRDDFRRAQVQASELRELCEGYGVGAVALELSPLTPAAPTYLFGLMVGVVAALELPTVGVKAYWVDKLLGRDRSITDWAIEKTCKDDVIWPYSLRSIMAGSYRIGEDPALATESCAKALAAIEVALQLDEFHRTLA